MFYVYILQSKKNGKLYIGKTSDLKRRVKEHNAGQNLSTKSYTPWDLIFYEAYTEHEDVNRREKYLKTTQGRQTIKRMLKFHFINLNNQGSTTG
jgi:putative endonuclease